MRHTLICALLLGIVAWAFASKGGGGDKKNTASSFKDDFTPIDAVHGLTLKSGYSFNGGFVLSSQKSRSTLSLSSMITYQKGNTTYVLPYRSSVNLGQVSASNRTNLQLLGVKIKLSK